MSRSRGAIAKWHVSDDLFGNKTQKFERFAHEPQGGFLVASVLKLKLQILDVASVEREAKVPPSGMLDDLNLKPMSAITDFVHWAGYSAHMSDPTRLPCQHRFKSPRGYQFPPDFTGALILGTEAFSFGFRNDETSLLDLILRSHGRLSEILQVFLARRLAILEA